LTRQSILFEAIHPLMDARVKPAHDDFEKPLALKPRTKQKRRA
jgi:hypothetical protein